VIISLYYYFGVIRTIYWSENPENLTPIQTSKPIRISIYACIVGMFFIGLIPAPLVNLANEAVKMLK